VTQDLANFWREHYPKIKSELARKYPKHLWPMNDIEQLCPNCGLCCDTRLFADVELRAGDERTAAKLGLTLVKKGKSKAGVRPAVRVLRRETLRIYADRPKRCRVQVRRC